jgi:uncharacterized protein VirK/YbjX
MAKPGRTMKTLRLADAGLLRARLQRFARSLRGLYALRYLRGQCALARVMAHPGLVALVRRRPRVLFKYLHRNYLAVGLDSPCRLAILTHHYASLAGAFPAPFLRRLLAEGLVLWDAPGSAPAVSITLAAPHHDFEGELVLALRAGGDRCIRSPPR